MATIFRYGLQMCLVVLIILSSLPSLSINAEAVSKTTITPFSTRALATIGEVDIAQLRLVPAFRRIRLEVMYEMEGLIPLIMSTDKETIFPGDLLSVTFQTRQFPVNLNFSIRIIDGEQVQEIPIERAEGERVAAFYAPGSLKTDPQLLLVGVGSNIASISLATEINSRVSLTLIGHRVQPSSTTILFNETFQTTVRNFKSEDVGANFELTQVGLELLGNLEVNVTTLTRGGFGFDLYTRNFSVEMSEFSSIRELSSDVLKLKTPIDLQISVSRGQLILGDSFTISGRVNPATSLQVDLQERTSLGNWRQFGSVMTTSQGTFTFVNSTNRPGTFTLRAVHLGSEYTTKTISDSKVLSVAPSVIDRGNQVVVLVGIVTAVSVITGALINRYGLPIPKKWLHK